MKRTDTVAVLISDGRPADLMCGTCGGPVMRVAAEPWERTKLHLPAWAHAAGSQDHTATLAVSIARVYRSGLPSQHAVKVRYADGLGATVTIAGGRVSWADHGVWADPGAYMLAPWYCPGHNGGVCQYGACDYIAWTGPDLVPLAGAFETARLDGMARANGWRLSDDVRPAREAQATESAARLARYARGDIRYRLQG